MAQPYAYAPPPPQQGMYVSPPPAMPQNYVPGPVFNPYQSQAQARAVPPQAAPVPVVQPPQKGTLRPGQVINVGKEQVVVERYLSEGGYAHVYLTSSTYPIGTERLTQHCLKRIAFTDKEMLKDVKREIDTMKSLRGNKYITQYLGSSHNVLPNGINEVFILMEFCSGGGIIDLLNKRLRDRLKENEILNIFTDVCEAVAFMHSRTQPLLHRDLKIENILSTPLPQGSSRPLIFKLCDFGSTTFPSTHPSRSKAEADALAYDLNRHTTLQYRSPEMVEPMLGLAVGLPADVWALGVLLYKLCYYTTPFEEHGTLAIVNAKYTFPSFPVYSPQLQHLIASMLMEQPVRRPSVFEVLNIAHSMSGTRSETNYKVPTRSFATSPKTATAKSSGSQNLLDFTSSPVGLQPQAGATSVADSVTPGRRGRPTPTKTALSPASAPAQQNAPSPSALRPKVTGDRLQGAAPTSKGSVDEAFGMSRSQAAQPSTSSAGGFSDAFGASASSSSSRSIVRSGFGDAFGASSSPSNTAAPQSFSDSFGASSFSSPSQMPASASDQASAATNRFHGMSKVKPFSPTATTSSLNSQPTRTTSPQAMSSSSSSTQRSFGGFVDSFASSSSSRGPSPALKAKSPEPASSIPDGNTSFESRFPSIEVLSSSDDGLTPTNSGRPPLRAYSSSSSASGLISPLQPATTRPPYQTKLSMRNLTGEHKDAASHKPAMQSTSKGMPLPRSTQVTGTAFQESTQVIRPPSPFAQTETCVTSPVATVGELPRPQVQATESSSSLLSAAAAPARDFLTGDNNRHDSLGPSMQPTLPDGSAPKMSRSLSSLSNRSTHLSPPSSRRTEAAVPESSDDEAEGPEDATRTLNVSPPPRAVSPRAPPSPQMAARQSFFSGSSSAKPNPARRVSDRTRPQSMIIPNKLMPPTPVAAATSQGQSTPGPSTMPASLPRRNSINDMVSKFESMSSAPGNGSLSDQQQRKARPDVAAKPGSFRGGSNGSAAASASMPAVRPKPVVPIKAKTLQLAPSEYVQPAEATYVHRTSSTSSTRSAPVRVPPPKADKPKRNAQEFAAKSQDIGPAAFPSGASSPERQQPVNMLIQRWNQAGASAAASGPKERRI